MNRESTTDLGRIKVHKNVIASIASLAASEVDGVKAVGKDLGSYIYEFFYRKDQGAVRVEIDKAGEVWVEVPLVIKFGFNIPEVAAKVQENVRAALEKMTSLPIKDINVNVQGIEKG